MKTIDPTTLRLAAVVESSDDAIISEGLDGRIETWNRAAERIFGHSAAEALGRPIDIIIPPERRAEDREAVVRLRTSTGVSHFETTWMTREGVRIPISLAISPVFTPKGEMIGAARIARDISTQKRLEREAFRLAAIVDSSEDAIVSKDLNGVVQTWNKAAERMFGYTANEIVGRPISTIIPPERLPEEDNVLRRIRAGLSIEHFETVRRRKDGSLVEISLSVSPVKTPAGTIIGASKIARDISIQRRLMREAEEANRVKDEFLAMLSHELRTPLHAVMGYAHMLRNQQFESEQRERALDVIERNVEVLSQLVADVLDVSRIVTGKVRLEPADADLVAVLSAAVDIVKPSADAKGVALRLEAPAAMPARVDAGRMQQVFWNLLSNAVKFTPQGGRIDVRLTADDDSTQITVSDTGRGILPESLPFIFQRFWQGESASAGHGGLGLGLALARHYVELHGGTIAAASEGEGKGATFKVTLPVRASQSSIR